MVSPFKPAQRFSRIIRSSRAVRASGKRFHAPKLVKRLRRHAAKLKRSGFSGEHVDQTRIALFKAGHNFGRPLNKAHVIALNKKLTAWHLLSPAGKRPEAGWEAYQQEIESSPSASPLDHLRSRALSSPQFQYHLYTYNRMSELLRAMGDPPLPPISQHMKNEISQLIAELYEQNLLTNIEIPGYSDLARLDKKDAGEISSGFVFEGKPHQSPETRVAIKIFPISGPHNISRVIFFQNHLDPKLAQASKKSPVITPIRDSGFTPSGDPYVVMDYVNGQPLSDWEHQTLLSAFSFPTILALGAGLVAGISAIHEQGLIFRDLHAGQVLLTNNSSHVHLIDYDFLSEASAWNAHKKKIRGVGVPGYAPPEVWEGSVPTFRLDVYSLSAVLYKMLTGELPRNDWASDVEIARGAGEASFGPFDFSQYEPLLPPSAYNSSIPAPLDEVILRGLAINPADRYKDAIEMSKAFHEAVHPILP